MFEEKIYEKIIEKKDFSNLPKKDVELAFSKFDKEQYVDEEKIKLTRDLLRKVFSAFTSKKILSMKDKDPNWILRKHLSTRERIGFYEKVYDKLLRDKKNLIIFDLGAGINGFSIGFFKNKKIKYIAIEAMGQLVNLMNSFFKKEKYDAKAFHLSLFELEKLKKIIKKENLKMKSLGSSSNNQERKEEKIIFLFKVLDSLEMLEKDYSKKLLLELVPLVDKVVVSFATRSMLKRTRFKVNRNWILNFIKDNFNLLEDFEIGNERYVVFSKKIQ